jgi:hypothetical protein
MLATATPIQVFGIRDGEEKLVVDRIAGLFG